MTCFTLNGKPVKSQLPASTRLSDVLRTEIYKPCQPPRLAALRRHQDGATAPKIARYQRLPHLGDQDQPEIYGYERAQTGDSDCLDQFQNRNQDDGKPPLTGRASSPKPAGQRQHHAAIGGKQSRQDRLNPMISTSALQRFRPDRRHDAQKAKRPFFAVPLIIALGAG